MSSKNKKQPKQKNNKQKKLSKTNTHNDLIAPNLPKKSKSQLSTIDKSASKLNPTKQTSGSSAGKFGNKVILKKLNQSKNLIKVSVVKRRPSVKSKTLVDKPIINKSIPSVMSVLIGTIKHIWQHKRLFFGVILIYFLLNLIFVKGLTSSVDIPALKTELQKTGNLNSITLGTAMLSAAVGPSNNSGAEIANLYQTIIVIICSLAFIWLFRQTYETKPSTIKIKIKQPFYEGMSAIIPFIFLLLLVGLQLLPMIIGISVFSVVQAGGLAATTTETALWGTFALLLGLTSFYMISASIFSLIIVTLPDMTPMQAYKNAKKIVASRRWLIMRKFLSFSILLILILGGLLILIIMVLPAIVEWVMAIVTVIVLPIIIGSGYRLYRSLL